MIKAIILTYEKLGSEMIKVAERVTGETGKVHLVSADDPNYKDTIENELNSAPKEGILFITDLVGTSHTNHLLSIKEPPCPMDIITGLSVPMLIAAIKTVVKAETDLKNMIDTIRNDSLKSILSKSEFFGSFSSP